MLPTPPSAVQTHNRKYSQGMETAGGGEGAYEKKGDRERKRQALNSFNMPILSLINISFILNIGWKYFYIKEKEDLFMALKGEHQIKAAKIEVPWLEFHQHRWKTHLKKKIKSVHK